MTHPDPRAAWLADIRAVLAAVEGNPELPLPLISDQHATFHLTGPVIPGPAAPRFLAGTEALLAAALGVTFAVSPGECDETWFTVEGVMPSGLRVRIRAFTYLVADRKVTGTRQVETVEWVRRPAVPDDGVPGAEARAA